MMLCRMAGGSFGALRSPAVSKIPRPLKTLMSQQSPFGSPQECRGPRRILAVVCPALLFVLALGFAGCGPSAGPPAPGSAPLELLNASYDPTRELWRDLNASFVADFERRTGTRLTINQSHGASGSQSRAVIDGLEADVATLSVWPDTEALHRKGLLRDGWEEAFPQRSLPYTSTVVFVVRRGNPHKIRDWPDLVDRPIEIITPSPKTSGNGRLSLLAAWGSVVRTGGTEQDAERFLAALYARVPVLDTGARGATTTFAQKGMGDVHLALESEAKLEVAESEGALELVYPPRSILHEPHVAVVDQVVDARGTRAVAEAYLRHLYTPEGQEIIARHHFRPSLPEVRRAHAADFPEIELFSVQDLVPGWDKAQAKFFADNGVFDRIYRPR